MSKCVDPIANLEHTRLTMSSSNRYSSLNRRAPTSTLFQDYPGSRPSSSASASRPYDARASSPYLNGNPYSGSNGTGSGTPNSHSGFRPATPNKKGQYSTSVLEELEAQNENTATTLLSQKVSQLKSLTIAIGDEIRDSSTLANQINDTFESTGVRLKGTMRRMLRMAERTGVGWKAWLLFFVAVWAIFAYVWLF